MRARLKMLLAVDIYSSRRVHAADSRQTAPRAVAFASAVITKQRREQLISQRCDRKIGLAKGLLCLGPRKRLAWWHCTVRREQFV